MVCGDTALHFAAAQKQTKMLQFLIAQKANYAIKNKQGKTALDIALLFKRTEAVKILRRFASQASKTIR